MSDSDLIKQEKILKEIAYKYDQCIINEIKENFLNSKNKFDIERCKSLADEVKIQSQIYTDILSLKKY